MFFVFIDFVLEKLEVKRGRIKEYRFILFFGSKEGVEGVFCFESIKVGVRFFIGIFL